MFRLYRPIYVFLRLLPFVLSFARDFRRWIFAGDGRSLSDAQHEDRAKRFTAMVADLGPTFIKGLQVLGTREDIVSEIYVREFKKLQDQVPPIPAAAARRALTVALGAEPERVFERFDERPIAAASLGQVYKASFDGAAVAVKLRRPGICELIEADLAAIEFLVTLLEFLIDSHIVRSMRTNLDEFRRVIHLELDFRNEALNADRFRKNFAPEPRIVIPRCFEHFTREDFVVFEFVEGVRFDDRAGVERLGVDTASVFELLTESYLRMVLVHGFLHADPHLGNIIVCADGRVAIIDYGMSVEIDLETREELLRIVGCVVRQDIEGIVEGFYRMKMVDPEINRSLVRDAAQRLLEIRLTMDLSIRQIQEIVEEVLRTFYRFPLILPRNLVYLLRAAALVEGIGYVYDERFNAIKFATPIVRRLLEEMPRKEKPPLWQRALQTGQDIYRLSQELGRVIRRLDRDEMRIRIEQSDMRTLESMFAAVLRRIIYGIFAATLAIAGILFYFRSGNWWWLAGTIAPALLLTILSVSVPLRWKNSRGNPWT